MEEISKGIPSNSKILLEPTKGEEAVLTPDKIEKIITALENIQYRALIETFVVTGGRINEIRSLNIASIKIETNVVWYNLRISKTKIRKVSVVPNDKNPVARYPKYLIDFLQSHPWKNNPTAPLFYSNQRNRLSEARMRVIIYEAKDTSGICKHHSKHSQNPSRKYHLRRTYSVTTWFIYCGRCDI